MSNQILEKYDVTISYLSRDEELAYAIYTELGEIFKIFVYTQHQKELAGGDGIELLRDIFIERANLIVILYREGWGMSDWTNTEEKAIQEFGLNNHWEGMLLVNLDGSKKPKWFPGTLFSLDLPKYGFQELIGAIKLRAQERGSEIKSVNAVEKAKILQAKRDIANKRKDFLNSTEGVNEAIKEIQILFDEIEKICDEITSGQVKFKYEKKNNSTYYLTGYKHNDEEGSFGFQVITQWDQRYGNTLKESKLWIVKVYMGRTISGLRIDEGETQTEEVLYEFDITPSMENRWRDIQTGKFYTSPELADEIVKMIIDFKSS